VSPCDPRRAICIDLLAEEYIDQPDKLGHVCRCRPGFSGTPGLDGSGCAPIVVKLDAAGLQLGVGRGLDVQARFARAEGEPEVISLSQLRKDVEALEGDGGAITSVATLVKSLAEGPVATNSQDLGTLSTGLSGDDLKQTATKGLVGASSQSAEVRSASLVDTADENTQQQATLTSALNELELDVIGLATDVGDLGDDFSELVKHVEEEIEDEVCTGQRVGRATVSFFLSHSLAFWSTFLRAITAPPPNPSARQIAVERVRASADRQSLSQAVDVEEARRKSIADGLANDLQDLGETNADREEDAAQAAECIGSTLARPPSAHVAVCVMVRWCDSAIVRECVRAHVSPLSVFLSSCRIQMEHRCGPM
jgi:hypothetical protein